MGALSNIAMSLGKISGRLEKQLKEGQDTLPIRQRQALGQQIESTKQKQGMVEGVQGKMEGLANIAGASTSTQMAGGAFSGIGEKLMQTGNPFAMAGGAIMKFTGGLLESFDKLNTWTNKLHESNMEFAEFSMSMAEVNAEQRIRDIELKRKQGENLADSARELAEAKSRADATWAPIEEATKKIQNKLGSMWQDFRQGFGTIPSEFLKATGIAGKEHENPTPFIDDVARANREIQREAKSRRPARFQPGGGGDF